MLCFLSFVYLVYALLEVEDSRSIPPYYIDGVYECVVNHGFLSQQVIESVCTVLPCIFFLLFFHQYVIRKLIIIL